MKKIQNILLKSSYTAIAASCLISNSTAAILNPNNPAASLAEIQPITSIIVKYKNNNNLNLNSKQSIIDYLQANLNFNLEFNRDLSNGATVYNISNQGFGVLSLSGIKTFNKQLETSLKRLNQDPNIEYADPDRIMYVQTTPNDTRYTEQWHYFDPVGGINLPQSWNITTGNSDITVAVVDTGVVNHGDYSSKILPGRNFHDIFFPNNYIDSGIYSFNLGMVYHGSHVAGTIGAMSNNNSGVAGVSWGTKILPVKVLGGLLGSGSMSGIIEGMRWAANLDGTNPNPANVLNMSLGGSGQCDRSLQSTINEITAKGITIVVAAGNDTQDASNFTPASCDNVITVAATNKNGTQASYSNFGTTIDIAAPGGEISFRGDPNGVLSTNSAADLFWADKYSFLNGTSMASPHVAGVVALMLSVKPDLTPSEVKYYLKLGAKGNVFGVGLVDTYKTLQLLQSE